MNRIAYSAVPRSPAPATPKKMLPLDCDKENAVNNVQTPQKGACSHCGSTGNGHSIRSCSVCGVRACRDCVFKGLMYKRMHGWKCPGCIGTPSAKVNGSFSRMI